MPILNVNTKSLNADRGDTQGQMGNIESNIKVVDIDEREVESGQFEKILVFTSNFEVTYKLEGGGELGSIDVKSEIVYGGDEDELDDVKEKWENDKSIEAQLFKDVLNSGLRNSQVEAIMLAKELKLPIPVKLRRFSLNKGKGKGS